MYVAIKNNFGDGSPRNIFVTFIALLFLVFFVGLLENFFRDENLKMRKIFAGAFATSLLVITVFSLAVMAKPSLSCDFHQTFHEGILGMGEAESCSNISEIEYDPPQKSVISLDNTPYKTTAYWAHGAAKQDFICHQPIPTGFKLINIRVKEKENLGKTRAGTFCEVPPPYCDGAGEFCVNYVFEKACFINMEWYNWYKEYCEKNNLPFSKDAVCQ